MWDKQQECGSIPEPHAGCPLTCDGVPLPVTERRTCHRCGELVSPSVRSHGDLVRETNPSEHGELSGTGSRWPLPLKTCGEATLPLPLSPPCTVADGGFSSC